MIELLIVMELERNKSDIYLTDMEPNTLLWSILGAIGYCVCLIMAFFTFQ